MNERNQVNALRRKELKQRAKGSECDWVRAKTWTLSFYTGNSAANFILIRAWMPSLKD